MSQHPCEMLKARHKRRLVHNANTLCCRGVEDAVWPSYKSSSSLLEESKRVSSWQSSSLVSNAGLVLRSSISLAVNGMSTQDGKNCTNITTLGACLSLRRCCRVRMVKVIDDLTVAAPGNPTLIRPLPNAAVPTCASQVYQHVLCLDY